MKLRTICPVPLLPCPGFPGFVLLLLQVPVGTQMHTPGTFWASDTRKTATNAIISKTFSISQIILSLHFDLSTSTRAWELKLRIFIIKLIGCSVSAGLPLTNDDGFEKQINLFNPIIFLCVHYMTSAVRRKTWTLAVFSESNCRIEGSSDYFRQRFCFRRVKS